MEARKLGHDLAQVLLAREERRAEVERALALPEARAGDNTETGLGVRREERRDKHSEQRSK